MIKIENLTFKINNKIILNDINIHFKKGKFYSILGPNGCGKSTLVKAIANIIPNYQGKIIIDNLEYHAYNKKILAQKIAFLMQFKELNNDFSVKEIVSYGRNPYLKKFKSYTQEDLDIIDWAINITKLAHLEDNSITTLSGGEKQRVYLALALAQNPEVLVLDEPTNHLDLKYQYQLLDLIKSLNIANELTIICILHDINQAIRYADEIIVMKDGRITHHNHSINEEIIYSTFDIKTKIIKDMKHHYLHVL